MTNRTNRRTAVLLAGLLSLGIGLTGGIHAASADIDDLGTCQPTDIDPNFCDTPEPDPDPNFDPNDDLTTCVDPATGRRMGAMWLIPRSAEDLGRRRAVHRFWAEGSYGLMGRTPDHVASVLTGFAHPWPRLTRSFRSATAWMRSLLLVRPRSCSQAARCAIRR